VPLEALGFEWDPIAAIWEKRLSELVLFKQEHGHCNVPASEDRELSSWVGTQRIVFKRGKFAPDKVERLEALGFDWDPFAALWEKKFSEIVLFKEAHGHCDVPAQWSENRELEGTQTAALPTLGAECRFSGAFKTRFRGTLNTYS
jgi:hypothetical protein